MVGSIPMRFRIVFRTPRGPPASTVVCVYKVLRLASIGVALAALIILARMGGYLIDAERPELSIQPDDAWRTNHSCLTAYAEAARFAAEPDRNIYEHALYKDRRIENLKVDDYHYPPPFLLLPGAMQRATGGYMGLRFPWFVFQLALLLLTTWLIVRWLGRELGQRVLLATPLFFIAPATLFTMQMGNFQSSAIALSMAGMIALTSSRGAVQASGGVALAYAAISKVFPGILAVYFVVTRRWRALAWLTVAGLALTMITLGVYGARPFDDFVHYQMPRLSSGEAFPQAEWPRMAAGNHSFYGVLVKLRVLGLDALDSRTGLLINSIYGFAVLALACAVAWARRAVAVSAPHDRLITLTCWLAILNLASFRSPFVGGGYGMFGTVWLVAILIGGAGNLRARLGWAAVYAVLVVGSLIVPTPLAVPTTTRVALSGAINIFVIAVNAWVAGAALRRHASPATTDSGHA